MHAVVHQAPLHIDLWSRRSPSRRVAIRSQRPVHAARIFARRQVDEVLALLPRLFSVCAVAQAHAARAALAAATGREVAACADADGLLLMETAREHLWRVLVDWPAFLDEALNRQAVLTMQSLVPMLQHAGEDARGATARGAHTLDALLEQRVFGRAASDWLALPDRVAVHGWCYAADTVAARLVRRVVELGWERAGATPPRCLPELPAAALDQRLAGDDADDFIARPDWCGEACETTPLARLRRQSLVAALEAELGAGLLTRLVALLAELAELPRRLAQATNGGGAGDSALVRSDALAGRVGIAQVDAARGRLVHRVVVDGDTVTRYQVVAPTEWNFHPRGVLAASLAALDATDTAERERQAALLAMTIDPCVEFSVRVH